MARREPLLNKKDIEIYFLFFYFWFIPRCLYTKATGSFEGYANR